jgi:hypothetical protein
LAEEFGLGTASLLEQRGHGGNCSCGVGWVTALGR